MTTSHWYLLHCKPGQHARAQWHLTQQAFEHYSPEHAVKRIARGKVTLRNEALFPGYVFVRLHQESNWQAIRATRGVSRVVSFNGAPHPVPDELIAALQERLAAPQRPAPLFKVGERVVITEGCFKHVEAIVKGETADERIIVLMQILQTEQTLEMSPTQLARAG